MTAVDPQPVWAPWKYLHWTLGRDCTINLKEFGICCGTCNMRCHQDVSSNGQSTDAGWMQATQEAHAARAEQEVERLRAELNQVSGGGFVQQTYKKIARQTLYTASRLAACMSFLGLSMPDLRSFSCRASYMTPWELAAGGLEKVHCLTCYMHMLPVAHQQWTAMHAGFACIACLICMIL